MKTALVTGVTGQDGSYLAELLLEKGYRVVGTTRDVRTAALPAGLGSRVTLVPMNLLDAADVRGVVESAAPDEIYNCAAYSSGAGMYEDPVGLGEINGLAVTRLLEALRAARPRARFCQASSREIFGEAARSPQSELTPPDPRSPYGAAKLYADAMVRIHRRRYGTFACSAILYNHESPRRRPEFVTRKITQAAAAIKLGLAKDLALGSLEARRDWGYAGDHVRAMWAMLQAPGPDDYVVATGVAHTVREFCEAAFGHVGLDYRDHVKEDAAARRPDEPVDLVGDIGKARSRLGWSPAVDFAALVRMMVDADLQLLSAKMKGTHDAKV